MQKDNEIRTLRAQHKQKEMVLKRKQEEVRTEGICESLSAMEFPSRCIYYVDRCVQVECVKQPKI